MKIDKIKCIHPTLGEITVNREVPKSLEETIGDTVTDFCNSESYYHGEITKMQNGQFHINNLMVIKNEGVIVGPMRNAKGNKNYITVVKNLHVNTDTIICPTGVISYEYKEKK